MLAESGNDMSITVNGQSRVPPGFRFHPTEEELLSYYLRKKVAGGKIDLDVIREVDLNKLEPWDIQERCRIGSTPQNDWYFFSHKDKKYPTGTRTNRATAAGFWKATGRDKVIYAGCGRVGMRKTLVFYRGRAPHGQKSDWIMHEYRLDEPPPPPQEYYSGSQLSKCSGTMGNVPAPAPSEDGWVVCRVFKKKNHHDKVPGSSTKNSSSVTSGDAKSSTQVLHSCGDETLDQILQYLGRSCKQESNDINAINPTVLANSTTINNNDAGSRRLRYLRPTEAAVALNGRHQADERLVKLPALEPPSLPSSTLLGDLHPCSGQSSLYPSDGLHALLNLEKSCLLPHDDDDSVVNDWAALDRLVASHLGAAQQPETSKTLLAGCSFEVEEEVGFGGACCSANTSSLLSVGGCQEYQQEDMDLWALAPAVVGGRPTGPSLPNPKYSVPM